MALHPGERKRHFLEEAPVVWDPIRRDLQENEDWSRDLVEHSHDLLCVHDLAGRFLALNPGLARLLGYSVEEVMGKPVRDFIDPQYRDQFDTYLREIERTGEAHGLMALVARSGERRIWEYHNTLRTEDMKTPHVRGIAHDVTERVLAEQTRRQSNEQLLKAAAEREEMLRGLTLFRTLLDQSTDAIQVIEPGTLRLLDVNETTCAQLGYSRDELLAMTIYDIAPEFDERARAEVLRQLDETRSAIIERVHRRKDGTTFPVEVNLRRVHLDREYGVAITRDITARKQSEARLREFEKVVESLEEMIVVVDRDYRYVIANRSFLNYRGMTREQVVGRLKSEVVGPVVFETIVKPKLQECFLSGQVVTYEMKYTYPRRGERDLLITYFPVEGPTGTDRVASVMRDISERKRADEALRQSEERFRVAIKNSPITVFQQDRDLRYTWLYHPTTQRSASEFIGKTTEELFGPEDGNRIAEFRRQVLETGVGVRHEAMIPDSQGKHYFDTTVEPLLDSTGAVIGLTGASMDVTELRETTEALREAKKKLTEEKLYLEQEIDSELGFGDIIGRSKALQSVMEHVSKVASSNATVLLLGETGTGKELVARAIHRMSERAKTSFIKMNCAAIPSGLLESELFGNEKGAFTGAVSKKIGRLELADKGTLFLDEIGEISLALQPKLLRVLQDQEFERLGGTQTIKADFRLIAATNRDLAESVREKEFRSDLYYRLNVFPIRVPPLRERREDIPLLVEHFAQKFARRMNRSITTIPQKTMDALMAWEWPGNVRELENFIERSVILSQGSVLVMPLIELQPKPNTVDAKAADETLSSAEREHILRALRQSRGQIGGQNGAAMRLGLKRTTLQSKLKNLGINPRHGALGH